jgi:lipopolysaccharide transport system permease protein
VSISAATRTTRFERLRADVHEMFAELAEYRELLLQLARRDLTVRYKQTVMGFAWALFVPVLHTAIFTVIFTRATTIDTGGVPYPIFAYSGLLPWVFFATSLRFAIVSLTANTNLVTKVYFPREMFPFAAVLVAFVDFAVGATVLVALMIYYGVEPSWTLLFIPVVLVVQVLFTLGLSLLLSMANLFYRDVKYVFEVLLTVWMFATSVVYPIGLIGGTLGRVLQLNPMSTIIDSYRDVIIRGVLPPAAPFAAVAVLAVATLAIGWMSFHRAEFRFAENI